MTRSSSLSRTCGHTGHKEGKGTKRFGKTTSNVAGLILDLIVTRRKKLPAVGSEPCLPIPIARDMESQHGPPAR